MMDITVEKDGNYQLNDLLKEVKKSDDWVVFGKTAIQKSHIKRIVSLDD
jgi:hypothetical protein